MAAPVKLPWELEEDILSRLPPESLIRFRSLCKQWNSLFTNKRFINNHLSHSRPQFILVTGSKIIYSIDIAGLDIDSIDSTMELRELPSSDIPSWDLIRLSGSVITSCDELLFCNYRSTKNEIGLWNPWSRQVKWIEHKDNQFYSFGLGYNNSRPEKVYKILGLFVCFSTRNFRVAMYDCGSHVLKFVGTPDDKLWFLTDTTKMTNKQHVSLNGNLYWVTRNLETDNFFIISFDFSRENFKPFSLLPCHKNNYHAELFLAVYKGDRFSLLKQCCVTRKIGIWVTKKNIGRDEEEVVWIHLMTLPTTNLPTLSLRFSWISYFIYDKTIFMCYSHSGLYSSMACIYIVREGLCKKIQINSVIGECGQCVYTPNLMSVPFI